MHLGGKEATVANSASANHTVKNTSLLVKGFVNRLAG